MIDVIIYTDGACSNNGRPETAQAGIGVYWPGQETNNLSEPLGDGRQTNQRAEIAAARRGIEQARGLGYKSITVRTDSEYVRKAVDSWLPRWDRDGWPKNVVNRTDFQRLQDSMKEINVKFERVPSPLNRADALAKDGAKKASVICRRLLPLL